MRQLSLRQSLRRLALTACVIAALAQSACEGSALTTPSVTGDSGTSSGAPEESGSDAAAPYDDGTPIRQACSSSLGSGLSPDHGRLDGTLVSIVAADQRGCPSDPTHLHLQVLMKGSIYDIAVNLDGLEGETDVPMPGAPFEEGWHPMAPDYVSDLGLHSTDLTVTGLEAIRARVVGELARANHLSVFGTGYPGSDGAHRIHRETRGRDGALVINPGAPKSHVLAFRFASNTS